MKTCEVHFPITRIRLVPNIPQKALSEAHHHSNLVWIIITYLAHTWPSRYDNHTTSCLLLLCPINMGNQVADREEKKWNIPKRSVSPVTSLGSSLNARHSPWTSGQLGKAPGPWPGWSQLEKAGEGWTRLLGLVRPGLAGKHWSFLWTLTESQPLTLIIGRMPQSVGNANFKCSLWSF